MEKYIKSEKLGEGTYGVVYKGKCRETGRLVAIKKIRMEGNDEGIPPTALREVSLLKELDHPNIVSLLEEQIEDSQMYLVFEFVSVDLKKYLDTKVPKDGMDPLLLKSFMYQMTQALLFCHKRRILHRDLKPQNILVSDDGVIKIADFGLGRAFGIPMRVYTHEVITLWYRAPEILLGSPLYACPVDIWSLGCIFAEMAMLKPLFCGDSEIDQLFRIFGILTTPNEETWPKVSQLPEYQTMFPSWTQNRLAETVKRLTGDALDLLKNTLIYDPVKRITARQMVQHPYFKNIKKMELLHIDAYEVYDS